MDKRNAFISLAQEVSDCHICRQMVAGFCTANGEFLENDDHGLNSNTPYVNLWNLWQGDLDASIMVIGQDYGTKDDVPTILSQWENKNYDNPTDKALRDLFQKAFNFDIDSGKEKLFFTNMANCYRKQKTSGGMHTGWLPVCAHKFMARLIKIISPKIIIVLGQSAFEAMFCLDGIPLECANKRDRTARNFAEVIQHDYYIVLNGKKVPVCPVYHPGANSNRNRTPDQQREDWIRIKNIYDKVK